MSDRIEIFGFAPSTFVRTARMACIEKGVAHDLKPLEFRKASHEALHPYLKIPAMRFKETVLFETIAITVFVDEAFDGPALQPDDAAGCARMHQWASALAAYAFGDLVAAFLGDNGDNAVASTKIAAHFAILDNGLEARSFLAGNNLSIADLFLAPMLAFAEARLGGHIARDFRRLSDWRDRMWARESFRGTAP